jgi:dTDP-4-dehydrorhamnose reductase
VAGKLVVFGASGFVGGHVVAVARAGNWDVCPVAGHAHAGLESPPWRVADIASGSEVRALLDEFRPDAVVNAAAIADIDKAERDQELAWRINTEGARYVAQWCGAHGSRLVFFSTDAVFSGEAPCYREEDPPAPVNFYGRTKMEAERAVLNACPGAAVIRVSLILGFPILGGNSALAKMQQKMGNGEAMYFPREERRSPIDVYTLTNCVLELADNAYSGILHVSSTEGIDRYELALRLARRMALSTALVLAQTSEATNALVTTRAPRHRNGVLDVSLARRTLRTPMPTVDQAIGRALSSKILLGGRRCSSQ